MNAEREYLYKLKQEVSEKQRKGLIPKAEPCPDCKSEYVTIHISVHERGITECRAVCMSCGTRGDIGVTIKDGPIACMNSWNSLKRRA